MPGPVPPTAIPAYYARQPDRPNPPLPRSPCVPAVLDRLYEPRGPLAAPQAAASRIGGPRRTIAAEGFPRAHTIADGDTLPGLAARYLNDAQRGVELFEANRKVLSDPAILPLGAVLKIPPR